MSDDGISKILSDLRNQATLFEGTFVGGLAGVLSSYAENRNAHDSRRDRDIDVLRDEYNRLLKLLGGVNGLQLLNGSQNQLVLDFLGGLTRGKQYLQNNIWQTPTRDSVAVTGATAATFQFPPKPSTFDNGGNVSAIGELVTFSGALLIPELRAFLAGLANNADGTVPTSDQIRKAYWFGASIMAAVLQGAPPKMLVPADLNYLLAQIATDARGEDVLKGFSRYLLSPAVEALVTGFGSQGPLSATQTTQVGNYFATLLQNIIGAAPGGGAGTGWIPTASPSLADPALDAPWAFTYNPSTLTGTPNIGTATWGGVVVNTAVVASCVFGFRANSNEQQTVRRFLMKVTNLSTAAAGQAARFYLPKALAGAVAPKVTLGVSGNTWAQAGYPYANNETGGAMPYFDIYVVAGTNSAAWYLVCDVSL